MQEDQSACLGDMTAFQSCLSEETLRADLVDSCRRLARIWRERAEAENALWREFETEIKRRETLDGALSTYRLFVSRRMKMATEDVQRTFEEYRDVSQAFDQKSSSR